MEIVIIGSGNVAYHFIKAMVESKVSVKQLFGRNETELKAMSEAFAVPYSMGEIARADLYLICVSDSAVGEVSELIPYPDCVVAHTSGSLPMDILRGGYRKASFYPLQTFSKTKELDYSKIPFFIETECDTDFTSIKDLALKISSNVMKSDYEKRKYIHLTAVFSCNFVNHLFAQAKEIADLQGIPFEYFLPLIDETVQKIHFLDPKTSQTGPAVRNDRRILALHEELITDELQRNLYKTFNASIQKMYHLD